MNDDVIEVLNVLNDNSRFFSLNGETNSYFYDSYTQGLYTVNTEVLSVLKKQKTINIESFSKLSIEEYAKIVNFIATIHNNNKDRTAPLSLDSKCSVMINTSNRCNMNCSYCYRNKKNANTFSLSNIKKTIEYAMTRYKPDATEFVISYSMTSESSVDLPILKQIADEYINYENYQFTDNDIINDNFCEFIEKINNFITLKKLQTESVKSKKDVVIFLNSLLSKRDLYEILEVTDRMFNDDAKWQIQKRQICTKWKLYRINRWCLEVIFDKYIEKKHVPYVTFWFMSNGMCASSEFIDFIKACDINPFWISIDGPKEIHNSNRKINKNGSYDEIIHNINIFKQNGINLKASVVLTSKYPRPLEIIEHLINLGFTEVSMTPVRPGFDCSFDKNSILELCNGYDEIFEMLEDMSIKNDFSLFKFLKEDLTLAAFNIFTGRTKLLKRCSFDDQIVVNSKGEIYPCLYFTDNEDFCLGNIKDGIYRRKINHNISVNERAKCKKCWARYLCGGTCFYGAKVSTGDYLNIDPIECVLKKHLAEKCLRLLVFLKEHNISINQLYN